MQIKEIKLWEKVAFSATFLRSIGWQDAGRKCSMRGTVINIASDPLYIIHWGDNNLGYVNKFNLISTEQNKDLNADAETSKVRGYDGGYTLNR